MTGSLYMTTTKMAELMGGGWNPEAVLKLLRAAHVPMTKIGQRYYVTKTALRGMDPLLVMDLEIERAERGEG